MANCSNNYCVKGSSMIHSEHLTNAMNYREYLDKIYSLLQENKTTGDDHSERMLHYTRMNTRRMELWEKNMELLPEVESYFKSIDKKIDFLVITEAWCGDAAPVIPLIQKIVNLNKDFSIKTILRDEHPEIMDQYLTNGTKSIPVIVAFQSLGNDYVELFKWGPRPLPMMKKYKDFKDGKLNIDKSTFLKEIHRWYEKDKTYTIQNELLELMKSSLI